MKSLTDPAHKIDRQFKALDHFQTHGWSYPLSAEIDLTWRCALNCKGCHSKWLHTDKELNQADIVHILGQLAQHGCKSVTFSGGGDPLESPHWKYAILSARLFGMDVAIYSYLPGFDQEKADYLGKQCQFVYTHSVSTKRINKPSGKCVWTYGYLLDSTNWHQIPALIDKVDFDFFDHCDFRPLSPINAPDPPDMDYSWVARAIEVLENVTAQDSRVKAADYKFYDLLKSDKGRNYGCCYSTDFTAMVGPDGTMYECINRRNVSPIGNLLAENLKEIWQRKQHKREDFDGCRILCRNHQMNKSLWNLLGPEPQHASFI
jgi:MoaA/NifB/PqqE/SkfB family radical SAM enzyme